MKITRNNYESFFIDFIEGNITPDDEKALRAFLVLNPDLQQEFDEFENLSLEPENSVLFPAKEELKNISQNKASLFQESCIAYFEDDLSETEKTKLEAEINQSEYKKTEFHKFGRAKLIANNAIVYQNKQNLRRKDRRKIVYLWMSAAANIILLFGVYILWNYDSSLQNTTTKPILAENQAQIKRKDYTENAIAQKEITTFEAKQENKTENNPKNENIVRNKETQEQVQVQDILVAKNNINKPTIDKNTNEISNEPLIAEQNTVEEEKENGISVQSRAYAFKSETKEEKLKLAEYRQPQKEITETEEFVPLNVYLKNKVKEKLIAKAPNKKKINVWEVARIGVKGLSKITGKKMEVENHYDENDNLIAFEFKSENIEIKRKKTGGRSTN